MGCYAMIYGHFSSAIHGPFDLPGLYTTQGLTGSESSFFNLALTLAERGHRVVAFCDCEAPWEHPSGLVCMPLKAVEVLPTMQGVDAVIAWNEPDYLRFAPKGAQRIVDQQLNDWGYCRENPTTHVDTFVFPSQSSWGNHKQWVGDAAGAVIPNSVDLGLFVRNGKCTNCGGLGCSECDPGRHVRRVVYCSSPDRGLHHLLAWWPAIRARVPDAELKIFYRIAPWLERCRDHGDEVGRRARFIETALERLTVGWGVEVVGLVPNAQMARELQSAAVLAYPCDPVSYTEGFGCSVLDAAAAGCLPIISDADALAEVHGGAACVSSRLNKQDWIDRIAAVLEGGATETEKNRMWNHAQRHSREAVTDQWERLLNA